MATPIYEFAQLPHVATRAPAPPARAKERSPGEAPRVGVIYNPRSHRNQGADFDCGVCPQVHIATPDKRDALPEALSEFAKDDIDLLVINGGDGTVRDVLTCGSSIFGDNWPAIAVLPKGKTNALTVDLGVPSEWSLQDAIDAFDQGDRVVRRPLDITDLDKGASSRVLGFILGAGAFTRATSAGQSAHKLGAFNSAVVGVTTAWALMQAFFASRQNPWRRGSRMAIKLGRAGSPMAHSGAGDPEYRQLMLATTLERLPAGLKPFGRLRTGLRMVVLDQVDRRTAVMLPLAAFGKLDSGARERGIHQLSVPEFTLAIEDSFIFDGEAFPKGRYRVGQGPALQFVTPKAPAKVTS
ncbi:MAG: diacylglycerol kinase family protein [Erythrobacter sp.]|uniref:diacylglycerol/lipid kinase family protein n=1 Tax=Erythrobacter sp. TaxID=1042 RepID=UPI00260C1A3C|nr:diacylglycerol kinase family protein [Erythrobacter sp.]MDJ0979596.1 diacylglycerol kinase family protein [Erythrobacter sp.]